MFKCAHTHAHTHMHTHMTNTDWIHNILSLRNLLFVHLYLALLTILSILYSLTYTGKM